MSQTQDLIIKGYRGGVLITLPALSCHAQRDLLIRRIQSQERFFKGGRIALDVGQTHWNDEQIGKLLRELSDEGVCLWAILSKSSQTVAAASSYDIPTSIKRDDENTLEAETPKPAETIWLERDIEEGETLDFNGKLCLIGNVHPNACVKANGSIVIWGKAAGEIWAGEKSCPKNAIYVLNYNGATFHLNGKSVNLTNKSKPGSSLHIYQEGETVQVEVLKTRRFAF